MTQAEFRQSLKDEVNRHPDGIKGVALAVAIMNVNNYHFEFYDTVEDLVKQGEIREETYVDPDMPYREKSKYFPV